MTSCARSLTTRLGRTLLVLVGIAVTFGTTAEEPRLAPAAPSDPRVLVHKPQDMVEPPARLNRRSTRREDHIVFAWEPLPGVPAARGQAANVVLDCTYPRADYVSPFVTVGTGSWGRWGCASFCPPGSFAYDILLRSESSRGGGIRNGNDDTALNAIALSCWSGSSDDEVYQGYITSQSGNWGEWVYPWVECESMAAPIVSAEIQIEASQGGGNNDDDTAANAVRAYCADGTLLAPGALTNWGSWSSLASCPAGTAVCGLQTRVEPNQGTGINDDTALNGLKLICCPF